MILLLAILLAVLVLDPPASVVVLAAGCVLEVVEITVLRQWSKRMGRRSKPTTGAEAMLGRIAEVAEECRPRGSVRVNGELWEARCDAGASRGERVVVDAVEGLTLVVSRQAA